MLIYLTNQQPQLNSKQPKKVEDNKRTSLGEFTCANAQKPNVRLNERLQCRDYENW